MKIEIAVTPYVFKYLAHTYGHPPYELGFSQQNDLRVALEYMQITAQPVQRTTRIPYRILLDLGDNLQLARTIQAQRPLLKAGMFFQHEFNTAMRKFVQAQEHLARKYNIPQSDWNKIQALKDFLDLHGITDDEYSLESAYKQLYRLRNEDLQFLSARMAKKYGFRDTENQHFRLSTIHTGKEPQISFVCFSRSAEDMVPKKHRIPKQILTEGDWETYAQQAVSVIDDFLTRGFSAA